MSDEKFILPSPAFKDDVKKGLEQFSRHLNPHFSTPNGMLLPRHKQPPPMYGPRGSTIPPQYVNNPWKRPCSPRQFKQGPGNYSQANPGDRQYNSQRHPSRQTLNDGCSNRSPRSSNNGLDKEVNPELLTLDWKLWCQGCDVNCRSEADFKLHISNHKPCIVRDCKFVGHPMIMRKHERQAHKDETCVKVAVGPSTEEIKQWRDERRKRYPTKQNVILRQQAQEARVNRGERIEENKERFPNRQKTAASEGEQLAYDYKREETPNVRLAKRSKRRKRSKPIAQTQIVEKNVGRKLFVGTSTLKNYKKPAKTALSMLGEYGSDSEHTSNEEEVLQEIFGSKSYLEENDANENPPPEAEKVLSEGEIVDDEAFGEAIDSNDKKVNITEEVSKASCTSIENVKTNAEPKDCIELPLKVKSGSSSNPSNKDHQTRASMPRGRNIRKPKKSLLNFSKLRRSNQNTMLEKLLDSDIRHERNVLLQCVRYVLVNKFFGIGQPEEQNSSVISVCEDEKK